MGYFAYNGSRKQLQKETHYMKTNTIACIANKAGVSIATVSRALSGSNKVANETKQRIMQIADEMGYEGAVQKARTGSPASSGNTILVMVRAFSDPFFSAVINGIQNALQVRGYSALVVQTYSDPALVKENLERLARHQVAGVIACDYTPANASIYHQYPRSKIIFCCEYNETLGFSYVAINDKSAARKAVNYLLSSGHKRIAFMSNQGLIGSARMRESAYLQTMEQIDDRALKELKVSVADLDFDLAFTSAERLLTSANPPDAIFCVSDIMAAAVIKCAQQHNIRIPQDLAIIGFDDIDLAMMVTPALTTMRQPRFLMGELSGKLMVSQLSSREYIQTKQMLEAELVIRETT